MSNPRNISIKDFTYHLPVEKIANFPWKVRDRSKLLVYNKGKITDNVFNCLEKFIPAESLMIFNNSKVINARIRFKKPSGSVIEVFCLEPYGEINDHLSGLNQTEKATWKCMVGGASGWKGTTLEKHLTINNEEVIFSAVVSQKISEAYIIAFAWHPGKYTFAEIIEVAGEIPLPPYLKRQAETSDYADYQTTYALQEGSVAAPTGGLHFTSNVLSKLSSKNIETGYVTLHVGAGTFRPVKAELMTDHEMHAEWINVSIKTIQQIIKKQLWITAVGTTSLRTIETLYWLGVKTCLNPSTNQLDLKQWCVYERPLIETNLDVTVALTSLIHWLETRNLDHLFTQTQLLITPGYKFKIVNALVTNFHQPQSTLLLLVAAAVGNDWKAIYDHALLNDYRFLSYGDSSLLVINPTV